MKKVKPTEEEKKTISDFQNIIRHSRKYTKWWQKYLKGLLRDLHDVYGRTDEDEH